MTAEWRREKVLPEVVGLWYPFLAYWGWGGGNIAWCDILEREKTIAINSVHEMLCSLFLWHMHLFVPLLSKHPLKQKSDKCQKKGLSLESSGLPFPQAHLPIGEPSVQVTETGRLLNHLLSSSLRKIGRKNSSPSRRFCVEGISWNHQVVWFSFRADVGNISSTRFFFLESQFTQL